LRSRYSAVLAKHESSLSESFRIQYRIGINLGDVLVEDGDLFGDGVNVAARLEQLAEPGGICISGAAYDQVRPVVGIGYQSLGEIQAKNIDRPIRAYKVLSGKGAERAQLANSNKAKPGRHRSRWSLSAFLLGVTLLIGAGFLYFGRTEERANIVTSGVNDLTQHVQSIAIFPFRNLGPSNEDDYLAVGIADDIRTDLAAIPELLVVTPTVPIDRDGSTEDIRQVARDGGAKHALIGSVRRSADEIRVNATLFDSETGRNLWSQGYNRQSASLSDLGRDIAANVTSILPNINPIDQRDASTRPVHFPDPEAYDLLLQGNIRFSRFTPQMFSAARDFYRRAIEIDPEYARPTANLAYVIALTVAYGWSKSPKEDLKAAEQLVGTALQLDPSTYQAYIAKGLLLRSQRRHAEAISSFEKAIEISPNSADAYSITALTYVFAGQAQKALSAINNAMKRNPNHPFYYLFTYGTVLFQLERYNDASEVLESAIKKNPDFIPARLVLASAYAKLGRLPDAEWEYQEVLVRMPDFSLLKEQARVPYSNTDDLVRYMDGLRTAAGAER
jgi:TolB-like protein/Flp pilus assembly protein TadD